MKYEPALDDLFSAFSDGARRTIISRLARGPASVSELASGAGLSLPSAHAHLAKLEAAQLVESEKTGRTRICRLRPAALAPARTWLQSQEDIWSTRLERFDSYVTDLAKTREEDR